jgi:hypothetical protein
MVVAASTTPAASPSVPVDRAYDLIGTWTCESTAGSTATMAFTRQSDGSISLRDAYTTASGTRGEFDEAYRIVLPAQYWSWVATWQGHPDFKEAASAGMWTAQKWFFDGTVADRPKPHDTETHRIRIVYTRLTDASFEREFETYDGGVWKRTSSSVCRRQIG